MEAIEDILGGEFDATLAPAPGEAEGAEPPAPRADAAQRADRVKGMLYAVALGDALGAPHEFHNQIPLARYTGRLEHPLTVCRRFQGGKLAGGVGQVTDDTEMMMALAYSILAGSAYSRAEAINAYLVWANSKCPFMGNNTRALFVGVKTVPGYERRAAAKKAEPPAKWSQSNGCLMRCAPLAVLSGWEAAAAADCALTNPHPVCLASVRAYVCAAHELLAGASAADATARALAAAAHDEVAAVITSARGRARRDVSEQKGWALHALYCAFYALNDPAPGFEDKIDRIVRMGGDTDTNAAIAGALLGAHHGFGVMRLEGRTGPNIERLEACDTAAGQLPRPPRYAASLLDGMALRLAEL